MIPDLTPHATLLPQTLRKDQHRLRRDLDRLRADTKSGKDIAAALEDLQVRIAESVAARQARASSVPVIEYPETLPVSERKDEIREALLQHQVIIVCGETGSGKTTQLPKIYLEAGRGLAGRIGHTQPRRIVLATNVAETSLTVPGIRSVIDTGYARISRYSHRGKLQRLPIEKIPRASANQRSGRCGRVDPGTAIRPEFRGAEPKAF